MSSWYSPQKPTCPLKNDGWTYYSFWNKFLFRGHVDFDFRWGWGGLFGQIGDKKQTSQETLKSLWDLSREARFKRVEIRAVERRQLIWNSSCLRCRMNEWYPKIYPKNAGILGNPWKTTRQMVTVWRDFSKSSCNIYWVHFAVCWINLVYSGRWSGYGVN